MLNCIRPFDCTRSRDRTGMSLRTLVFETSASTNYSSSKACLVSSHFVLGSAILHFVKKKKTDKILPVF